MNISFKSNMLIGAGLTGLIFSSVRMFKLGMKHADTFKNQPVIKAIKQTWKDFIPVGVCVVASTSAVILGTAKLNNEISAATTVIGITQTALSTYKDTVEKTVDENTVKTINKETGEERLSKYNDISDGSKLRGQFDVICFDSYLGRKFYSNINALEKSITLLNRDILNYGYSSVNDFYYYLGEDGCDAGSKLGWTVKEYERNGDGLAIDYEYGKDDNGYPVLIFNYNTLPIYNFDKVI